MDGEFYRPKRLVEELKDMLLATYRAAGLVSRQERNDFPALLPCGHTTRDHGAYQMAVYLCLCVMLDYDPEPLHSWATVEREIEWMRREAKRYGLLCEGVQNDPQPKPAESLTSAAISKALEHEREVAGGCFEYSREEE